MTIFNSNMPIIRANICSIYLEYQLNILICFKYELNTLKYVKCV